MASANFTLGIDRRRLLASAAAAATATSVAPHLRGADAALGPVAAGQAASAAPDKAALSVSAGMARRLLEIARRNEIRREAALPLLSVVPELRRMKQAEISEEFARFEAAHGRAVWDLVLKSRREAEGKRNWRPGWSEGARLQSEVHKILWARFRQQRMRAGKLSTK